MVLELIIGASVCVSGVCYARAERVGRPADPLTREAAGKLLKQAHGEPLTDQPFADQLQRLEDADRAPRR